MFAVTFINTPKGGLLRLYPHSQWSYQIGSSMVLGCTDVVDWIKGDLDLDEAKFIYRELRELGRSEECFSLLRWMIPAINLRAADLTRKLAEDFDPELAEEWERMHVSLWDYLDA